MTTTSTKTEHDELVAGFDRASSQPDWPAHRVLSDDGELIANHIDDIELPDWADEVPDDAFTDVDLDEVIRGWGLDDQAASTARVEPVSYRRAHQRVEEARGKANTHACVDCGQAAAQWAYDHEDAEEFCDAVGGKPYSMDVEHYQPRCLPCHGRFDRDRAKQRRNDGRPSPGWTGLSFPPEASWMLRRMLRNGRGLPDDPVSDVRALLGWFIGADHDQLDTVALWIAGTWLTAYGVGEVTPRLKITAYTYGAGKSTLLGFVQRLAYKGESISTTVTDALIPRMLEANGFQTLCVDEADRVFDPRNAGAVGVVNAGWQRGATTWKNNPAASGNGWAADKIPVHCAVAFCGNGVTLPDDTKDRTLTVRLRRREDMPEVHWGEELAGVDERLRERLDAWAQAMAIESDVRRPPAPSGLSGRPRDRWSVLMSAAVAMGGPWPEKAHKLARDDHEAHQAEQASAGRAPGHQLALDLHEVWPASEEFARTSNLLDALHAHDPDRWGHGSGKPLTAKRLAWLLGEHFQVHPIQRSDPGRPRGFLREDMQRAWTSVGIELDEQAAS